jgi:hypothetical protein
MLTNSLVTKLFYNLLQVKENVCLKKIIYKYDKNFACCGKIRLDIVGVNLLSQINLVRSE